MYSSKNIAFILTSLEAIEKLKIYTKAVHLTDDFFEKDDHLIYGASLMLLIIMYIT